MNQEQEEKKLNILADQSTFNAVTTSLIKKTENAHRIDQGNDQQEKQVDVEQAVEESKKILTLQQFLIVHELLPKIQASDYVLLFRIEDKNSDNILNWTYIENTGEQILLAHGKNSSEEVFRLSNLCISKLLQIAQVQYVSGSVFSDNGSTLTKENSIDEEVLISILMRDYNCQQECIIVWQGSFQQKI